MFGILIELCEAVIEFMLEMLVDICVRGMRSLGRGRRRRRPAEMLVIRGKSLWDK
ncbi:hypothetical protein [Ktedonosporobacter rubrisoli]|uniref:hypothetical protein n=1 Tax=Ktedonosporobacter rubrisoli TaxID=2509675 RepID=UPI0013EEBE9B|nr:hypothetical protein [Ktedonosporobacter rubrisoli]